MTKSETSNRHSAKTTPRPSTPVGSKSNKIQRINAVNMAKSEVLPNKFNDHIFNQRKSGPTTQKRKTKSTSSWSGKSRKSSVSHNCMTREEALLALRNRKHSHSFMEDSREFYLDFPNKYECSRPVQSTSERKEDSAHSTKAGSPVSEILRTLSGPAPNQSESSQGEEHSRLIKEDKPLCRTAFDNIISDSSTSIGDSNTDINQNPTNDAISASEMGKDNNLNTSFKVPAMVCGLTRRVRNDTEGSGKYSNGSSDSSGDSISHILEKNVSSTNGSTETLKSKHTKPPSPLSAGRSRTNSGKSEAVNEVRNDKNTPVERSSSRKRNFSLRVFIPKDISSTAGTNSMYGMKPLSAAEMKEMDDAVKLANSFSKVNHRDTASGSPGTPKTPGTMSKDSHHGGVESPTGHSWFNFRKRGQQHTRKTFTDGLNSNSSPNKLVTPEAQEAYNLLVAQSPTTESCNLSTHSKQMAEKKSTIVRPVRNSLSESERYNIACNKRQMEREDILCPLRKEGRIRTDSESSDVNASRLSGSRSNTENIYGNNEELRRMALIQGSQGRGITRQYRIGSDSDRMSQQSSSDETSASYSISCSTENSDSTISPDISTTQSSTPTHSMGSTISDTQSTRGSAYIEPPSYTRAVSMFATMSLERNPAYKPTGFVPDHSSLKLPPKSPQHNQAIPPSYSAVAVGDDRRNECPPPPLPPRIPLRKSTINAPPPTRKYPLPSDPIFPQKPRTMSEMVIPSNRSPASIKGMSDKREYRSAELNRKQNSLSISSSSGSELLSISHGSDDAVFTGLSTPDTLHRNLNTDDARPESECGEALLTESSSTEEASQTRSSISKEIQQPYLSKNEENYNRESTLRDNEAQDEYIDMGGNRVEKKCDELVEEVNNSFADDNIIVESAGPSDEDGIYEDALDLALECDNNELEYTDDEPATIGDVGNE